MSEIELAVIGGSGLYSMQGLEDVEIREVDTPFGPPSDNIVTGRLGERRVAFLARHGRGHILNPTEVPYRANIYALKSLGVRFIVAVNACGSLREHIAPGHIVVPNQLFDRTTHRPRTFFENGLVAHISVADPFDEAVAGAIARAVREAGGMVHEGGNFVIIEGPRFSTRLESEIYRQLGLSIIGMTSCPEAFLAAEAEIAYASMAHVTDYDVWHQSEEPVTVEMVIDTLNKNTRVAQEAIAFLARDFERWAEERPVHTALKDAILTNSTAVSGETIDRFGILLKNQGMASSR